MFRRAPRTTRGLSIFEALVTALIIFLILSSVTTLLNSSLRAMKSQQGRELGEVVFLQEMLRRELADATSVTPGVGQLVLRHPDPSLSWDQLRLAPTVPDTFPQVQVSYQLSDGVLTRKQGDQALEPMLTLSRFESMADAYDLKVELELKTGERVRRLIWNMGSPAL